MHHDDNDVTDFNRMRSALFLSSEEWDMWRDSHEEQGHDSKGMPCAVFRSSHETVSRGFGQVPVERWPHLWVHGQAVHCRLEIFGSPEAAAAALIRVVCPRE